MKTMVFLLTLLSSMLFAAVPDTPANFREMFGTTDSNITVGWDMVSGADGYHIYRYEENSSDPLPPTPEITTINNPFATTYEFSSLNPYTEYTFKIDAFNSEGNSTASAPIKIKTLHTWRGDLKTCLNNQLNVPSDSVPTRQDVERVTTYYCYVSNNINYWGGAIRDIDELRDLVYVRDLNISGGIYVPFPQWIGELDHLFSLNLNGGPSHSGTFGGTIPADIGDKLPNLMIFMVGGGNGGPEMELHGPLPASFGNMNDLQVLSIRGDLNGSVPTTLGTLANLQTLDLPGNHFTSVPSELANLTALQYLNLSENNLTTLPDLSPLAPTLTTLNLAHLQLNAFPTWIGSLSHLEHLDYSYTPIDGRIPGSIKNLTALKSLDLRQCGLQGTIPDWIGNLTALESLYLSDNVLFGTIPYSITNLTNIPNYSEQLKLYDNCNLFSNNSDVQSYIHNKSCDGGIDITICLSTANADYDRIAETDTHQCEMGLSPIRALLLLN